MLPNHIDHLGTRYSLSHLHPRRKQFNWTCENGDIVTFDVRVRCSDHCVSEEVKGQKLPTGTHIFKHPKTPRYFRTDRYAWSLDVPKIIDDMFKKPTTQVRLTIENNWYMFRLHMRHPLPNGEKYYCFLRMRFDQQSSIVPPVYKMELYVESAYSRDKPPLTPHRNERLMFGRLLERLMLAKK